MHAIYECGEASHVGLVRGNNEDAIFSDAELGLWLIADGMGGHEAGEVASGIAKETIALKIKAEETLSSAILIAHQNIIDAANNNIGSKNMGTTVIALLSKGDRYQLAWVGDSRAYLWNSQNNSLSQISKDHSVVQSLFEQGLISKAEMATHPNRNVITQSLGIAEIESLQVDTLDKQWQLGDKILLCSDGLTDLVSDDEINHQFRKLRGKPNQLLVDSLIESALAKGGKDNVSVQIISAPSMTEAPIEKPAGNLFHRAILAVTTITLCLTYFWLLYKNTL